jgi:hypothetical protein
MTNGIQTERNSGKSYLQQFDQTQENFQLCVSSIKQVRFVYAHDAVEKQEGNQQFINRNNMKERIVRAVAGTFVLLSISLAYFVNVYWLGLALFVGLNLLQSSFTRFCPLEKILERAGVGEEKTCC